MASTSDRERDVATTAAVFDGLQLAPYAPWTGALLEGNFEKTYQLPCPCTSLVRHPT